MVREYKFAIIGGGVAGLTFGYLLKELYSDKNFIVIEKGNTLQERNCPYLSGNGCTCKMCNILSGIGGGGFFSDGKIIENSGWYIEDFEKNEIEKANYILFKKILSIYPQYEVFNPFLSPHLSELLNEIKTLGFEISIRKVFWYGSEEIKNFAQHLANKINENILLDEIRRVEKKRDKYYIIGSKNRISSENVIIATGRYFNPLKLFDKSDINVKYEDSTPHIGVRVEVSGNPFKKFSDIFYDLKLYKYGLRTFCFNPFGKVIIERHEDGKVSVNGLSYRYYKTAWTNFAIIGQEIPLIPSTIPLYLTLHEIDKNFKESDKKDGTLKIKKHEKYLQEIMPQRLFSFIEDLFLLSQTPKEDIKGFIYYPEIKLAVPKLYLNKFKVNGENIYFIGESTGRIVGIWASMISAILLFNEFFRLF